MDDLTLEDVARLLGERDLVIAKLQKELARVRAELVEREAERGEPSLR